MLKLERSQFAIDKAFDELTIRACGFFRRSAHGKTMSETSPKTGQCSTFLRFGSPLRRDSARPFRFFHGNFVCGRDNLPQKKLLLNF